MWCDSLTCSHNLLCLMMLDTLCTALGKLLYIHSCLCKSIMKYSTGRWGTLKVCDHLSKRMQSHQQPYKYKLIQVVGSSTEHLRVSLHKVCLKWVRTNAATDTFKASCLLPAAYWAESASSASYLEILQVVSAWQRICSTTLQAAVHATAVTTLLSTCNSYSQCDWI